MVVGEVEPIRPMPELPMPETDRARKAQEARLAVLTAYDRFGSGLNLRDTGRTSVFVGSYNMGHIKVDDWVRAEIPSLSRRTLARWRSDRQKGLGLGIDRGQARKGLLDTANGGRVKAHILGLIAHQPDIKAERVHTLVQGKFGELVDQKGNPRPVPPIRTIQHTIKRWKVEEVVVLTQLSNPDAYRSTMAPVGTRTLQHIKAPNVLWQIDASPLDAMSTDEHKRPTLYACLDIGTRRLAILITRTPRADAVALLFRKAILAWGVPKKIKTDNGSDFVAEDTKRLFDALGIEMELSTAYSPQQKGHVERVIRTFQHNFAELLPACDRSQRDRS